MKNRQMKKQTFMLPLFVAVTFLLVAVVSAADVASSVSVEVNGASGFGDLTIDAGDTIPVRVAFHSLVDASEVELEVEIKGLQDDVSEQTNSFPVLAGNDYSKLLSLEIPSDLDDRYDRVTLVVTLTDLDSRDKTVVEYLITLQPGTSYDLEVVSVDYNTHVNAGDVFPVSVVVENTGAKRVDKTYVVAAIPSLGVSSRGYVGDLVAVEDYIDYDDEEDVLQKTVYLQVPEGTPAGVYEMVVTAYNDERDAETSVKRLVSVSGNEEATTVIATKKSQDVKAGETAEYELVIINAGDKTKVYTIDAVSSKDLVISVPAAVVVGAGDSKEVIVEATVPSNTREGTYTFSTDVDGKQVVFAANVVNDGKTTSGSLSSSMVGLTVVLVIVFIVLLVVLIILISRRDEETTEEVETSYY